MRQYPITIIVPIVPERLDALSALLHEIGNNISTTQTIRFRDLGMLHFASIVIFEADGPILVFEASVDGDVNDFLDECTRSFPVGLHAIYQCCSGYASVQPDRDYLARFLRTNLVPTFTFYAGAPLKTVVATRQEAQLHDRLQPYFDTLQGQGFMAQGLYKRALDFAFNQPQLTFVRKVPEITVGEWLIQNGAHVALATAVLLLLTALVLFGVKAVVVFFLYVVVLVLVILIPFTAILRYHEKRDLESSVTPDTHHARAVARKEDHKVQNHLASITTIKKEWFRLWTLKAVLTVINAAARFYFNRGNLGGIPSIHFARWVIWQDKYLIFLSNFDGSWEHYLGEFIDQAQRGLTAVWSNTIGFPRTKYLAWGGAVHEQKFKAYARNSQVYSHVWYNANPDLSVVNVWKNDFIRRRISTPKPTEAAALLERF